MNLTKSSTPRNQIRRIKLFSHDLISPLTTIRRVVINSRFMMEREKTVINSSLDKISGILDSYDRMINNLDNANCHQIINLHRLIQNTIEAKKVEYSDTQIKFNYLFSPDAENITINGIISDFERMLSNAINNAVESYKRKSGKVMVSLNKIDNHIQILIKDEGKGISADVLEKLNSGIMVTSGKPYGHGLGFIQISETVREFGGTINIKSEIGCGTEISLLFKQLLV